MLKLIDEADQGRMRCSASGRPTRVEHDDLEVYGADGETLATCTTCGSRRSADGKPNLSLVDSSRRRKAACATSAVHHHRRDRRRGSGQGVRSQGRRLQQHHGQGAADRLAEAPAPSGCTSGCARSTGLRPRRTPRQRGLDREQYVGIRPAPATRPAPTIPRKALCSNCFDPQGLSGVSLTEHYAMFPPRRSAVGISPTRRRSTSRSARSTRTRWNATASARAGSQRQRALAGAEPWLR